jgi:L-threonylcarbamoyladenylate synthase
MIIDHSAIAHATSLLKEGKLVAIPTETVYGLGADALNSEAIQKVYTAKGRPSTNPLIIHLANAQAMIEWAIDIPETAWKLAKAFWPGPLTLILPKHPRVPLCATGNQSSIGLRVPNHPLTLALLNDFGGGIAAPSANRYGKISPTTPHHVREELGESVDYILEGGPCQVGIESTIVSLLDTPVILRQGGVSAEALTEVLSFKPSTKAKEHTLIEVPGQSDAHYAPSKPLYIVNKPDQNPFYNTQRSYSVMAFGPKPQNPPSCLSTWIRASSDPIIYARELYANLRRLDHAPGEYILVESLPLQENWWAIQDRLKRASTTY